jgi:soluble lytic murein transglycosylase-like protein
MHGIRVGFSPPRGYTLRGGSLGGKVFSLVIAVAVAGTTGCAGTRGGAGASAFAPMGPAPGIESSYVALVETPVEETAVLTDAASLAPSEAPIAAAYARRYEIDPELALDITHHALAAGIDPELAFRLIRVESVFKVSARGRQGALGLMQLMPGTARSLDRSLDTEREILDPDNNLRIGLRYLRQMIERYDDVRLGLLAYNRGEGSVDRALRRGVDPENGYSRKVLGTRGSRPYSGSGLAQSPGE